VKRSKLYYLKYIVYKSVFSELSLIYCIQWKTEVSEVEEFQRNSGRTERQDSTQQFDLERMAHAV